MKIKLADLIAAFPAMQKFSQKEGMGAKASYRIAKALRKMGAEVEEFNQARMKVAKRYAEEKNGAVMVPEDKMGEFQAELKPLLDEEVELEGITKVAYADWSRVEHAPAVLADLHLFIEEPTE